MEVAGDSQILVYSLRKGTDLIQLICDNDANGYFLHHRRQGKLISYDWVADNLDEATDAYQKYAEGFGE